jgi:hypothetical protein
VFLESIVCCFASFPIFLFSSHPGTAWQEGEDYVIGKVYSPDESTIVGRVTKCISGA